MRVAFVHYHLRTGGVTTVLRDQAACLQGSAEAMMISGEPTTRPFPCPVEHVAALGYDRDGEEPVDARAAARAISAAVRRVWPTGATLYHFHNPTLGKNRAMSAIVGELQAAGEAVLLQIHDFAEDGRPELASPVPYPADCHYAVINRRDRDLLLGAGLEPEGVHYLPNAVRPHSPARGAGGGSLLLYPVRARRRKNVGEAVLLSCFLDGSAEIGVTLEPTGPLDRRSYEGWTRFVAEKRLPVRFGIGSERSLEALLAESRAVVTTSIKEGFGFAFLEPWTAGLPLYGRWLAETCPDFAEAGVGLEQLYRRIDVPLSWVDAEALRRKRALCGLQTPAGAGDSVDFGALSEDLQRPIVAKVLEDRKSREILAGGNPALERFAEQGVPAGLVEANRRVVLERFSLQATAQRLLAVYDRVLSRAVSHSLDKSALTRAFRAAEDSLLLCPGSYE